MASDRATIEQLKQALQAHRRALEALEEALLAELESHSKPNGAGRHKLLSLKEVGQELGMSRSWVYQSIKSSEIPHVKLGHNIKVRREDLEAYLQAQRRESIDE